MLRRGASAGEKATIPSAFDVRKLVTERLDKRGRTLNAFETAHEAEAEADQRVRRLQNHRSKESRRLARLLNSCSRRRPCESMACPICARTRRIEQGARTLKFLATYDLEDLRLLTLINPGDAIEAGDLKHFNPKKLISRTRRQLERAGIDKKHCFLIGAVDGEWDEGWRVFQPHIHAIAWNVPKPALRDLISKWPKDTDRVRVRKRVEPMDDLPRVVTYLDKSFWPCVARPNNEHGVHPHEKRRSPVNIEIEILRWLDQQSANEFRLLYGVKNTGGVIMRT